VRLVEASMAKRDPVAEYMAAHPERVHQGVEPKAKPSRARDAVPAKDRGGKGIAGWCSVTHEPVYALGSGETGVDWARHRHEGRSGCVILNRLVEGQDGRWHMVEPIWPEEAT
jgi:hypothetical protein